MYIFQLSKRYKNAKIQPVHTLGRAHHLLNIDLQNLLPKHLNIDPQLPHSQRPVQSKSQNNQFRTIFMRVFLQILDSWLPSQDKEEMMNLSKSFHQALKLEKILHNLPAEVVLFSHRKSLHLAQTHTREKSNSLCSEFYFLVVGPYC